VNLNDKHELLKKLNKSNIKIELSNEKLDIQAPNFIYNR